MKSAITLLIAALLSISLCACSDLASDTPTPTSSSSESTPPGSDYPIEVVKDGKTNYTIIYSNDQGDYGKGAATELSKHIFEATGVSVFIEEDRFWDSEYEIVLGTTDREGDSIPFKRALHNWYNEPIFVECYGKRLLITAKDDFSLWCNIDKLASIWLTEYRDGILGANNTVCDTLMTEVPKAYNDVSIMSHNVYYKEMQKRKNIVAEELAFFSPDLIGIQEATVEWMSFLDPTLSDEYGRIGVSRAANGRGEYNPIFYKKDKFDLLDSGTFWLSNTPSVPGSRFPGADNDRIATWGLFEIKQTGKKLLLLNTHLDTAGEDIRTLELELIFDFLEDYDQYPIYMTGDFNFQTHYYNYKKATELFHSCHDIARSNLSEGVPTYNDWGSRSATGDYIFANKETSHEILLYRVINERRFGDFTFDEFISDHYAVFIKTRIA